MRERPILFSGPMVKALLAGTKTQTRRIVNMRDVRYIGPSGYKDDPECWGHEVDDNTRWAVLARQKDERFVHGHVSIPCPYGEAGDALYVRETHYLCGRNHWPDLPSKTNPDDPSQVLFYAEGFDRCGAGRKRPGIHMPRWGSRIRLLLDGVRVERLQAITDEDARAEGVTPRGDGSMRHYAAFRLLWCEINGHQSWDENPWVWVVSFKRERP